MKHTVIKTFTAWEFDKEEKWLNDMAAKGLHLCKVGPFKYVFEEGLPGEYVYRMELLDNQPKHQKSIQYISFIEDTGAEKIGSLSRWVYFRKKTDGGAFDLYSDIDSRIKHLDKIIAIPCTLLGLFIINGIAQLSTWLRLGRSLNLILLIEYLLLGSLTVYGLIRMLKKRKKLYKEKILHE